MLAISVTPPDTYLSGTQYSTLKILEKMIPKDLKNNPDMKYWAI
jgi:hypothetical protein